MINFDDYITTKQIVYSICRFRAQLADKRNKKNLLHKISNDTKFNYHKRQLSNDEKLLNSLLPSRKKWRKLGKGRRLTPSKTQKISSIEFNIITLLITIDYYRKYNPNEQFIKNLDLFVQDVKSSYSDKNYNITPPIIHPKLKSEKKKDNNVCRPISKFSLKDSIIIGAVNRYFTDFFDNVFLDCALAFRSAKVINDKKISPKHHDAIREIIKHKNNVNKKHLWVAESDMNKFYDSVNHTVVRKQFKRLINVNKLVCQADSRAINIFYKYLDCYSFTKNVLPKNNDPLFWRNENIPDGKFGWVEDDIIRLKYYKNYKRCKIGIPQGGSLSGLIANIVLHYADIQVKKDLDKSLGYFRFCDDMVIIHPNRSECKKYVSIYNNSLKELKLVPHNALTNIPDKKTFWSKDVKSKGPYKWSTDWRSDFSWIGFVGYEINYNGSIRVRKSSLKKELKKQKLIIDDTLRSIKNKRMNISEGTVIESTTRRLLGMSIGRGDFWNMNKVQNEKCWIKGYTELNDNFDVRRQIHKLDKGRNKRISRLKKKLTHINFSLRKELKPPRRYVFYGKPYSYFYHVIEKNNPTPP